jgi:hypothetical protein
MAKRGRPEIERAPLEDARVEMEPEEAPETGAVMEGAVVTIECPAFILTADMPRGVQALMAALAELAQEENDLVRAFELWEEAHREG